jgi:Ca2+-binding EF-hand superfamily protein
MMTSNRSRNRFPFGRLFGWIGVLFFSAVGGAAAVPSPKPAAPAPKAVPAADATNAKSGDDVQDLIYLASSRPIVIRIHVHVEGKSLYEFRSAVAKRIFDSLDADHNGTLEKKEIEGIPTPEMFAAAARQQGGPITGVELKPDSHPADGRVTREELTEYVLAQSGAPLGFEINSSPGQATIFNGVFQTVANLDVTPVLALIDADSNGKLSAAEFANTDNLFRMLDINDDETISRAEISTLNSAEMQRSVPATPLAGLSTFVQPIDRWGTKMALIRKLIQVYDRTSRDPKTRRAMRDKKLTPAELGIPAASLLGFDQNKDGALDVKEAAAWLSNPDPEFEIDVFIRRKQSKIQPVILRHAVAHGGKDSALNVRTEKDGQVVFHIAEVPIELRTAPLSHRSGSQTRNFKNSFKQADRNNNGYLETDEIRFAGLGPEDFSAMDRDHNGMVFEPEWMAFMQLRASLIESRVALSLSSTSTDPVEQFDTNRDGRLSHVEFAHALEAIKAWDVNHDERIAPSEIPHHYYGTFRVGSGGDNVNRAVGSRNGQTGIDSKGAPVWFQKMDRNRDGQVSLREFLGPVAVFRSFDANHDGFLDAPEIGKASK